MRADSTSASSRAVAAMRGHGPNERGSEVERKVADLQHSHRDHGVAVMAAEVRTIEHALEPWDVLSIEALRRRIHANHWHPGTFEEAVRAAVRRGVVELLPGGLIARPRRRSGAAAPRDAGGDEHGT